MHSSLNNADLGKMLEIAFRDNNLDLAFCIKDLGRFNDFSVCLPLLEKAILSNALEFVGLLLDMGVPTDQSLPMTNEVPLSLSVLEDNIEAAEVLLNKGADPLNENNAVESPISMAKRLDRTDFVARFEESVVSPVLELPSLSDQPSYHPTGL